MTGVKGWLELAGVIITFLTALLGVFQGRKIHVLVNSQLTDVIGRVAQLTAALTQAGVDVPPRLPPRLPPQARP